MKYVCIALAGAVLAGMRTSSHFAIRSASYPPLKINKCFVLFQPENKFCCLACYSGEASAFTPAAMPALQRSGFTSVCMAGGPPYLDSLGSVAAAPAAAKVSVPFDPKELLRVPWIAGSESKSAAAKTQVKKISLLTLLV